MLANLNAKPQNILNLFFTNLFRIPKYQRSYSWDIDKCDKLWTDLLGNFEDTEEKREYFLGSIVLVKCKDNKRFDVIDGQQRLITLSIMLRALKNHDASNSKFREMLYVIDTRDDNKRWGHRVETMVLGGKESKYLEIVLADGDMDADAKNDKGYTKSNYCKNLAFFEEKIGKYLYENKDDAFCGFVDHVFENVYILPVETDDYDKALAIFETINDRGMELSDGDIFKAQLYKQAGDQTEDFIKVWDGLSGELSKMGEKNKLKSKNGKDIEITSLFRLYMYLLRGMNNDTSKSISLRDFFDGKTYDKTKKTKVSEKRYNLKEISWKETLDTLSRLKASWDYLLSGESVQIKNWYDVLMTFGNENGYQPAIICIYYAMKKDDSDNWIFDPTQEDRCVIFIKNLVRFVYAKGLGGASQSIEDAMASAIVAISLESTGWNKDGFNPNITVGQLFDQNLDVPLQTRYQKGFCMILEILNTNGATDKLDGEVEHVLPKTWDTEWYDRWDKTQVDRVTNLIGNLVLLEKAKNIKGSNKFFNKKKEESYKKSKFAEARALCDVSDWTVETYEDRHKECKEKLKRFFEGE